MNVVGSVYAKGLIALTFGALVPLVEVVAATSESPVPASRPRLALVSLVAPELLDRKFVQDIDVREASLSRIDADLSEYVEWHRWAAYSLAAPPELEGSAEAPRQN